MAVQYTVHQGDITLLSVDVIVNAANSSLRGGGGVDGAIHRAAGPELLACCREIGHCPCGEARMTPAFNLDAKAIFHTVGPVWRGGGVGEPALLASCYRQCMLLLARNNFTSIAFPAVSCGVYGYPVKQAAIIAINEVRFLGRQNSGLGEVIFCCFDSDSFCIYHNILSKC